MSETKGHDKNEQGDEQGKERREIFPDQKAVTRAVNTIVLRDTH